MKSILDTHSFIWYSSGNKNLSEITKEIIDSDNKKFIRELLL